VKLDYLTGQQVQSVTREEQEGQVKNTITFTDGQTINSTDAALNVSPEIQGTNLLSVTEQQDGSAVLQFGSSVGGGDPNVVQEITLTDYELMQGGPEELPLTVEDAVEHLPPDPSSERVADGPTGPEQSHLQATGDSVSPPEGQEALEEGSDTP
jgi:hypothetical protein